AAEAAHQRGGGLQDLRVHLWPRSGREREVVLVALPCRAARHPGRKGLIRRAHAHYPSDGQSTILRRLMPRTLEIIVDSISAAVTRCSRDLRYVWASKPYAEWLGLRLDRIVDRPIVEVVGERAFARLLPYFERVLRGESVHYETEVDFRGIGPRWIEGRYTPTFDAHGVDGWVAVIVDLSDRKRVERERDEMLRREQVAREAAEAATRQRDTLFSMISHELRTPLTPILTWAEILRDGTIGEEQRLQAIETIERCVGSQTKLIEDLLDVARIAAGK